MSRLVKKSEFAKIANVSPAAVSKWLKEGRITAEPSGLIDADKAMAMREATESPMPHHQARKAQFDEARAGDGTAQATSAQQGATSGQPAPAQPASDPMPAVEKIGAALKLETYKLQKAKAEQANVDLDKMVGALVERAEVDFVLHDFGNTLRGLLESLPDRLAPAIAAHRGDVNAIHKALEDTAHDLLTEMAELMKRKMETLTA